MRAVAGARGLLRALHLYLSLALGLVIVAIAATGAPLVWRDHVDRLLAPERYAISGSGILLTPASYAANARAAAGPDFGVVELRYPVSPGWPVTAALRAPAPEGRVRSLTVTLDPPTGRALAVTNVSSTVVGVLHNFHHMLMVPQWSGRQIVGWFGMVLLFLALSGLYLWWPRNGGFLRGMRWRRGPGLAANLHHLTGFWVSLPLSCVAATGVYLAFPEAASRATSALAATSAPMRHGYSALPLRGTRLDADRALGAALDLAPHAAPQAIAFPVRQAGGGHVHGAEGAQWRILLRPAETHDDLVALVDDASGAARLAPAPQPGDRAAVLIKGLHEARRGGQTWSILVFLAGVGPAALFVSGVVMWLGRRGRRMAPADSPAAGATSAAG